MIAAAAIAVAVVGLGTGIEHVSRGIEFVLFIEAGAASVISLIFWLMPSRWHARWAGPFAFFALVAALVVAGVQSGPAANPNAVSAAGQPVPLSDAARKSLQADANQLKQSGHSGVASLVTSIAGAGVVGAGFIYQSTSLLRAAGPAGVDAASTLLKSALQTKVSASLTTNVTVDHPTFSLGGLSFRPAAAQRGPSYSRLDITHPVLSLVTVRAAPRGHGHHRRLKPKTLPYGR